MSQNIDLKEIEKKGWRSVFQDGLWDIYMGLLLLAIAIGALLSEIGVPKAWPMTIYVTLLVLSMLVVWAGKKFITVPRMGRVKFGPKGKARKKKTRLVLAISVLVGMVFFVAAQAVTGNLSKWMTLEFIFPAGWVVNCIVVFSLMAYFLDFSRLYLIGVLYALPVPLDIIQREFEGIDLTFAAFGVPAAVILFTGAVVFIRFLRDYPLPTEGASDGND